MSEHRSPFRILASVDIVPFNKPCVQMVLVGSLLGGATLCHPQTPSSNTAVSPSDEKKFEVAMSAMDRGDVSGVETSAEAQSLYGDCEQR